MTTTAHKHFLKTIVESYRNEFASKNMNNVLAISLRCVGSVDRAQIDKIYVIIKVINKFGKEEQFFLGAGEVCKRGAVGILESIETACINILGIEVSEYIFKNMSIVTDGASVNIGERGGLWTLFQQKWRSLCEQNVPLIKIWCAAHRSNLVWKDARHCF